MRNGRVLVLERNSNFKLFRHMRGRYWDTPERTAKRPANSIGGLGPTSSLALTSWQVAYVSVQSNLEFTEGLCLNLACVLQFSYPVGFLFFKASDLSLNLNSLLVFFVNTTDQVESLLLAFQGLFLGAQLLLLLFLPADHMLHGLRL